MHLMVENNVPFLSGISENLLSELVPAPDLGWFWAHLTWRIVVFYEKRLKKGQYCVTAYLLQVEQVFF